MPIMGMLTASYTCQTMRKATGNTHGPDRPPKVLARMGRRVRGSMRMPNSVLIRHTPSAPASSQARATAAISAALGDSFIYTGLVVTALTASVTRAAISGEEPNAMPPPCTLGQEMFTSNSPTCSSRSSRAQVRAYSSTEKPLTLAITFFRNTRLSLGSSSRMTARTPGFCRPTALSMPQGASAMRGVGLPKRASSVVPLNENVPNTLISYHSANSWP